MVLVGLLLIDQSSAFNVYQIVVQWKIKDIKFICDLLIRLSKSANKIDEMNEGDWDRLLARLD